MTPENVTRAELEALAGRELTDVELEAIAGGKEFLSKIDPGFAGGGYGRGGGWGAFGSRSLPGRGGRIASNAANTGRDYA